MENNKTLELNKSLKKVVVSTVTPLPYLSKSTVDPN